MTTEQFQKIFTSAEIGNALFIIAGALTIIAYVMASKTPKKRRPN